MADELTFAANPPAKVRDAIRAYHKHGSLRKAAAATDVPKSTIHSYTKGLSAQQLAAILDETNEEHAETPIADWPVNNEAAAPIDTEDAQDREHSTTDTPDDPTGSLPPASDPDEQGDDSPADQNDLDDDAVAEYSPQTVQEPPDRRTLDATIRYINLLANGVYPTTAQAAATSVSPDFDISDESTQYILDYLRKMDFDVDNLNMAEALKFGNRIAPPGYVTSVYDQYAMDGDGAVALSDALNAMYQDGYLGGINHMLGQIGRDPISELNDPDLLDHLRKQADDTAMQIVDTYNRDLANAVGSNWIGIAAQRGNQMSRAHLDDAISDWASNRAQWKAEQIATTESSRAWMSAQQDFVSANSSLVQSVRVTPDACQCSGCQDLVDLGDMDPAVAARLSLPLHPNCIHGFAATFGEVAADADVWTGYQTEAA